MRGRLASAIGACVMVVAGAEGTAAQAPLQPPRLEVCLVFSQQLPLDPRGAAVVLGEATAIWTPLGVGLRRAEPSDDSCDRLISVKGDHEARPEDATSESAIGWVPFVKGRARQLLFLRVGRARTLIDALSPGTRPEALTELLAARLLGRILGHELGHVLLNSRAHEVAGLMRARFRERDVLTVATAAYTLNAAERARLFARMAADPRVASR